MNSLFEELFYESYQQEHDDAVKLAQKDFNCWIDLIIWDLLEIRSLCEKEIDKQKVQQCLSVLKTDIQILNNNSICYSIKKIDNENGVTLKA
jgi:hypothetical protein